MDITHNLIINASAETIYQAVATKEGINGWWSKDCMVGEKEGEKSLLKFDKQGTIVEMGFQTNTLVPNKSVVWTCIENANPAWLETKIITEISDSGNGSKVVFSHAGFDEKWKGQEPFEMTKQRWEHFVYSLVSYCENGEGQPW
ncbi:MAG: SRPBCC domain-containing protein [Reichenbachiella sp.]|uniref:SRPBCC family protein n=1 Tax=Reichenbachiella sp. TaxID=2184521 RepID=UPI003265D6EF